jgi:hypothetical protein
MNQQINIYSGLTREQELALYERMEASLRNNPKTKEQLQHLKQTRGWFIGDLYCDKDDGLIYVYQGEPFGWVDIETAMKDVKEIK